MSEELLPMDEVLLPEPEITEDPNLAALQLALKAAQQSLKILQKANDETAALKASRAIADIATKIVKLTPESEIRVSPFRRQILSEVENLLGQLLLEDYETRKQIAASLGYLKDE